LCKVLALSRLKTGSLKVTSRHAFNASWAADSIRVTEPEDTAHHNFGSWAALGARLRTANLTSFAWKKSTWGYHDTDFDHERVNIRFSVDYLSPHKDEDPRIKRLCSLDRHSFALEISDDSSIGGTAVHTVCPNRISVYCQRGRRVEWEDVWRINPYEPPNTFVIFEDSSHDEATLTLSTSTLGFDTRFNIDWIGRRVTIMYLDLIFKHLADQWSSLLDFAISHNRRLVSDAHLDQKT